MLRDGSSLLELDQDDVWIISGYGDGDGTDAATRGSWEDLRDRQTELLLSRCSSSFLSEPAACVECGAGVPVQRRPTPAD
ncbi:hypothetical protein ATANTOWER_004106 [Ataeniobius toweri]|uniref:Uncharacterized protein n=1 Tax=Ataeniobius toweri TaxID=208326 RepID=A0ABU7AY54_9TELE|nr:hypothetical protein [Ataeniobius toweri]